MSLLKENQNGSQNQKARSASKSSTFISPDMEVTGNFKSEGSIQVEGILHGNISVNSVVIGQGGVVNGIITANNVIINGKLKGSISCSSLEIMRNGSVSNKVHAKNLKVTGSIEGKIVVLNLLEINSTGFLKGEITVKNIRIDKGARVIGSLLNHKEEPKKPVEKKIENLSKTEEKSTNIEQKEKVKTS
jgi:cytoskeletal protein CcmA (bactofilin family)